MSKKITPEMVFWNGPLYQAAKDLERKLERRKNSLGYVLKLDGEERGRFWKVPGVGWCYCGTPIKGGLSRRAARDILKKIRRGEKTNWVVEKIEK